MGASGARRASRTRVDLGLLGVLLAVAVGSAAGLSAVLPGLSRPDSLQARARAIARELTCPVCQGQSVAESNSVVAARMREEIVRMLHEGRGEDEILSHYVDLYGPWILARPPATGFYVLLWGAPAVVLVLGGWWAFRRRRDVKPQGGPAPPP